MESYLACRVCGGYIATVPWFHGSYTHDLCHKRDMESRRKEREAEEAYKNRHGAIPPYAR